MFKIQSDEINIYVQCLVAASIRVFSWFRTQQVELIMHINYYNFFYWIYKINNIIDIKLSVKGWSWLVVSFLWALRVRHKTQPFYFVMIRFLKIGTFSLHILKNIYQNAISINNNMVVGQYVERYILFQLCLCMLFLIWHRIKTTQHFPFFTLSIYIHFFLSLLKLFSLTNTILHTKYFFK